MIKAPVIMPLDTPKTTDIILPVKSLLDKETFKSLHFISIWPMSHLFIISFLVTISSWNSKVSIKINKTITNNVQKSKVIRPLVLIDKNKKIKTKREYTNNIIVFFN